jgi:hypothetical protein
MNQTTDHVVRAPLALRSRSSLFLGLIALSLLTACSIPPKIGTAPSATPPRIVIDAGYGGQAFRASLGLYRDVCRNMMIMRQAEGTNVAIRHTSGLRLQMDELIETFASLEAGWGNLALVAQRVELGGQDQRRRQTRQVTRPERARKSPDRPCRRRGVIWPGPWPWP